MAIYIMTEDDLESLLNDAGRLALYYQDNSTNRRYRDNPIESATYDVMIAGAQRFKVLTAGNVGLKLE